MKLKFKHYLLIIFPFIVLITTVAFFRLIWDFMRDYLLWIVGAGVLIIGIYWIAGVYDPNRHASSIMKKLG